MRLLFVCMGNICRSPTAEAVMRAVVAREGLEDEIEIDSAGTGGWHVGDPPDARSTATAAKRGIVMAGAARQVTEADFEAYDLLLAADERNLASLRAGAPDDEAAAKVHLLREFDPKSVAAGDLEVPDPYYGGPDGFEHVLDLIQDACEGLLAHLRAEGAISGGAAAP
ncbi:MAG TPA: low molecular weight protein-tyrosine-phosphatase [Baekduia sp.]|nr:low molecular weight protein-tyrosine-phosphatase [Baekduia sp.]HET6507254.1 low molecular weight protein-tyrosine-phosphatase [Baekduia sp.]